MGSLDILILAVEASIAFAGFAGIVATFQFSGEKQMRRTDAIGLTVILQFSLLTSLVAAIAIALHSFNVKETTLWTICSVLAAIAQSWGIYTVHKNLTTADRTKRLRTLTTILQFPSLVLVLIHLLNISDVFFHREAGPLIASIVYALSIAGFMFSRLLLRPIWRNVRIRETATLAGTAPG